VLFNVAYITVVSPEDFVQVGDASQVVAIFFGNVLFGETGKKLISILIVISSCGAASEMISRGPDIIVHAVRNYKLGPKLGQPTIALSIQFLY
ncbi:4056_t:CDS:2, partial [Racocetra persica]